jgi:hypothetical protein
MAFEVVVVCIAICIAISERRNAWQDRFILVYTRKMNRESPMATEEDKSRVEASVSCIETYIDCLL